MCRQEALLQLPTAGPISRHASSLADLVHSYAACYCGSLAVQMDHLSLYALPCSTHADIEHNMAAWCMPWFIGRTGSVRGAVTLTMGAAKGRPCHDNSGLKTACMMDMSYLI